MSQPGPVLAKAWTLRELFAAAEVLPQKPADIPDVPVTLLADDSRAVVPGACFVAVRGAGRDGHDFIEAAARNGATSIIAEHGTPLCPPLLRGEPVVVRVGDTRGALAKLAAAFWGLRGDNQRRLCLIGITGTNGKTTVAWMLRSILRSAGERTALLGTVEYDLLSERRPAPLTTPGSLELCRLLSTACGAGATHGVMEVSSHALDQRRCDGLGFAAGVFTNLTGDHLDYHKTMEAYLTAKRRLFESLSREATAIINRDDPASHELMRATRARVVTYGLASIDTEVRAALLKMNRSTTEFVIQVADAEVAVRNSMIGRHNVLNALAAAATAHALGVSPAAIADGLRCMSEVPGRLQRAEPVDWPFSVFVDYAHTDDALRNVLTALRPLTAGRLICVFGCGGDRDRSKRPRMAAAVAEWADAAYVTSDNPRSEEPHAIIEEILPGFADRRRCTVVVETDRRRAIESALSDAHEGDTVLIAGKGHENYQIIGDRVLAFDDVDVARRWFAARERKREVA